MMYCHIVRNGRLSLPTIRIWMVSTKWWNPPPATLYMAQWVGFLQITVPRCALSPMSLHNYQLVSAVKICRWSLLIDVVSRLQSATYVKRLRLSLEGSFVLGGILPRGCSVLGGSASPPIKRWISDLGGFDQGGAYGPPFPPYTAYLY